MGGTAIIASANQVGLSSLLSASWFIDHLPTSSWWTNSTVEPILFSSSTLSIRLSISPLGSFWTMKERPIPLVPHSFRYSFPFDDDGQGEKKNRETRKESVITSWNNFAHVVVQRNLTCFVFLLLLFLLLARRESRPTRYCYCCCCFCCCICWYICLSLLPPPSYSSLTGRL